MVGDFVLDSKGNRFLCFNQISRIQLASEFPEQLPTYSIQYLSRYLKLDRTRVFKDKAAIPQQLLSRAENSNLKVELCEGCATLIDKFSKLFQQLEKIQLDVVYCLNEIQAKLMEADRDHNLEVNSSGALIDKLEIVDVLRKDVMQKCSHKLNVTAPRVRIRKLSKKKLKEVKRIRHFKSGEVPSTEKATECPSIPYLETSAFSIKKEKQETSWMLDYSDSSEYQNDDMVSDVPSYDKEYEDLKQEKTVTNASAVQARYVVHLKTGKYKCAQCKKDFYHKDSVRRHYQSKHMGVRYKCDKCSKIFTQISHLYTHYRNSPCGIGWAPIPKVRVRVKKSFTCRYCGKVFKKSFNARRHEKQVHLK